MKLFYFLDFRLHQIQRAPRWVRSGYVAGYVQGENLASVCKGGSKLRGPKNPKGKF